MFSENQIKAYKSISAPDELRQKILGMEKEEKKPGFKMRSLGIYAAAACLVLMVALSGIFEGGMSASLNGHKLGREPVAVQSDSAVMMLDARSVGGLNVDLVLETDRPAELTVSEGSVQIADPETGAIEDTETVVGKKTVRWTVDVPDEAKTYDMTLSFEKGKKQIITLEYDREAMCWTAYNK